MNPDRHAAQVEDELARRQRAVDFERHHPEYRNGPPPSQWPAMLAGLPQPLAQAFAPLIVNQPKEGNAS